MTLETLTICPVCAETQFSPYIAATDYLVSKAEFNIVQCDACQFRFTNPRPTAETIGAFYESADYVSHHDDGHGPMYVAYRTVRSVALKQKVSLITKLNGGQGRLLDVGCGTGAFLAQAAHTGWQVTGVEPDPDAAKRANERTNAAILPDVFALPNNTRADVITFWHVLEHVHRLNETIERVAELLNPGGKILIAVPNLDSLDAKQFGRFWAAYDLPRHLYHFTPDTITKLFAKHNFSLEHQQGMVFDSFYISLISNRYKTGGSQPISSLLAGLRSNLKAMQDGNFSSNIYVFGTKKIR
jgi:2-polyprenyl-3-methyl-5-hydroxy-6-metoxy-1,4-benzoquinol methylase